MTLISSIFMCQWQWPLMTLSSKDHIYVRVGPAGLVASQHAGVFICCLLVGEASGLYTLFFPSGKLARIIDQAGFNLQYLLNHSSFVCACVPETQIITRLSIYVPFKQYTTHAFTQKTLMPALRGKADNTGTYMSLDSSADSTHACIQAPVYMDQPEAVSQSFEQ